MQTATVPLQDRYREAKATGQWRKNGEPKRRLVRPQRASWMGDLLADQAAAISRQIAIASPYYEPFDIEDPERSTPDTPDAWRTPEARLWYVVAERAIKDVFCAAVVVGGDRKCDTGFAARERQYVIESAEAFVFGPGLDAVAENLGFDPEWARKKVRAALLKLPCVQLWQEGMR